MTAAISIFDAEDFDTWFDLAEVSRFDKKHSFLGTPQECRDAMERSPGHWWEVLAWEQGALEPVGCQSVFSELLEKT